MKSISNNTLNTFFKSIILIILALILSSCNNEKDLQNCLIVGTNSGFVPYESLDNNGQLEGFDMDLANLIAQKLGKKLIIKDMSFDALIISLAQNKVDLILAGISITKERLKKISMLHYLGEPLKKLPLIFWQIIPENVKNINDLKNIDKTICVQSGTIQAEIISKYNFLKIKYLENISDLITEIKYGKSIATVLEPKVFKVLKKNFPELKSLDFFIEENFQEFGNGIGIKKDNIILTKQIQNIIDQFKKDKTIEKLEKKWFKEELAC